MQYPNVLRRYVAMLLDAAVVWGLILLIARSHAITRSDVLTYALCGIVVLTYEPLLTMYGYTFGQWVMRLKVRTKEGLKRIAPLQAYGRFIVKYALGFISLLTIPGRKDRRAIHDLAADTIVVEFAQPDL
jgi:uncharacterized RDD family membrane protein YckC